jgi:hypothetical protein
MQLTSLLNKFGIAATNDIVPLIYAGLVDPLLEIRSQVNVLHELCARVFIHTNIVFAFKCEHSCWLMSTRMFVMLIFY